MNNLRNISVKGKKVLVRADFNSLPVGDDNSGADFKIKKAIPTLAYLRDHGAKIILISHLGRPKGKEPGLCRRPSYSSCP